MSDVHDPSVQAPAETAVPTSGSTGGPAGNGEAPLPAPDAPRRSAAGTFFGVVVRSRSWLNLLYLVLSFPLGVFYFTVLVTLLAVGISLVIIWVGIFILALTAGAWWAFASFERWLSDGLLGTHLQPAPRPWQDATGTWPRIKAHFTSLATWKDLAFLFLKFPLGVASFVIVVTLGAVSIALLAAPFYYSHVQSTGAQGAVTRGIDFGLWHVDRLGQALLLVPLGALLLIISLHAFNGMAAVWRAIARGLLETAGESRPHPAPAVGAGQAAAAGTQTSDWIPYSYPAPSAAQSQPPSQRWPPTAQPPAQSAAGQQPYPGQALYPGQAPSPYQGQPTYPGQPPAPAEGQPPYPGQPPAGQPPYPSTGPYPGWPYAPPPGYPSQPSYPPQPSAFPAPPRGEWPSLYGPPATTPAVAPATGDQGTPAPPGPGAPAEETSPENDPTQDDPPAQEERP